MTQYNLYKNGQGVSTELEKKVLDFLYKHLEEYGDAKEDIQKAIDYSLMRDDRPGGQIITAVNQEQLIGAVILNNTGMKGYIPENILVYIATHNEYRGMGIGKQLMQKAIGHTKGNIALHVEPNNPAKLLYENLGFKNKYLEMRLEK